VQAVFYVVLGDLHLRAAEALLSGDV
jgi:hypothetical protein